MLKRILIAAGLQAAPSPIAKIASAVVLFGLTPVAIFLAVKNRDRIAELVATAKREAPQLAARARHHANGANGSVGSTTV